MTDPSSHENPAPQPPKNGTEQTAGTTRRLKDKTTEKLKGGLAKLWSTGGGGFYGLGYLITFLWYEVLLLGREIAAAEGVADFVTGQLFERVFRIASDSLANSIKAFLWPVRIISDYELWGMAALALAWPLYTYFVHQRIVDYLGVDPEAEKKAKQAAKKAANPRSLRRS
jgi:hypothetical protein